MKSNSKKVVLWCVFIAFIKLFPRLDMAIDLSYYIYLSAFAVSVAFIYLVPKKVIGMLIATAITVGVTVYQLDYFLYALPVLLLIIAHREITSFNGKSDLSEVDKKSKKKDKNQAVDLKDRLGIILSVVAVACSGVQLLFVEPYTRRAELKDSVADFGYIICYIAILLVLFIMTFKVKSKKQSKAKTEAVNQHRAFYIASVICVVISVISIYMNTNSTRIAGATEFNYWFIFIVAIILDNDYYLNAVTEKFNSLVTRQ